MGFFDDVGAAVGNVISAPTNAANKLVPGLGTAMNPGQAITGALLTKQPLQLAPKVSVGTQPDGSIGVMPVNPGGGYQPQPPMTVAQKQEEWNALRQQREQDMARGLQRGNELFGQGSLGRQQASPYQGTINNLIAQRQAQAAQGLQAPEYQAQREQALQGLNQGQMEQARALRALQGRSGIHGGLAGAQQMQLVNQGQQARAGMERDLLLQNIAQKQAAQDALEKSLTGQQAANVGEQQFNLQQAQREKQGQLTSMLGEAQLGGAERGAVSQEAIGKAMQQAVQGQLGQGKK